MQKLEEGRGWLRDGRGTQLHRGVSSGMGEVPSHTAVQLRDERDAQPHCGALLLSCLTLLVELFAVVWRFLRFPFPFPFDTLSLDVC